MFLAVLAASAKQAGNLTDARATPPRDGRMVVQTSRRDRSFDALKRPSANTGDRPIPAVRRWLLRSGRLKRRARYVATSRIEISRAAPVSCGRCALTIWGTVATLCIHVKLSDAITSSPIQIGTAIESLSSFHSRRVWSKWPPKSGVRCPYPKRLVSASKRSTIAGRRAMKLPGSLLAARRTSIAWRSFSLQKAI